MLLILAGVAISALGGNDGLLAKVEKAKIEQMKAEAKENIEMAIIEIQTQEIQKGEEVTLQTLNNKLNEVNNKIEPKDYTLGDTELNGVYTVNKNTKLNFKIDQKLNVIIGEETEEEKTFPITVTEVETTSLRVTGDVSGLETPTVSYTYVAETSASNQIKFENITETSYVVTGLEPGIEYDVYMLAYDNAGNVTKSSVETVKTMFNPIISYDNEESLTVDVSVTYPTITSNKMQKQYSIDGVNYYEYTEPVKIKDNCTFYARVVNIDTNEVIVSSQKDINNIIYEWEVYSLDKQTHYELGPGGGNGISAQKTGTFYTGVTVDYNTGALKGTGPVSTSSVQSESWYIGKYIIYGRCCL